MQKIHAARYSRAYEVLQARDRMPDRARCLGRRHCCYILSVRHSAGAQLCSDSSQRPQAYVIRQARRSPTPDRMSIHIVKVESHELLCWNRRITRSVNICVVGMKVSSSLRTGRHRIDRRSSRTWAGFGRTSTLSVSKLA